MTFSIGIANGFAMAHRGVEFRRLDDVSRGATVINELRRTGVASNWLEPHYLAH